MAEECRERRGLRSVLGVLALACGGDAWAQEGKLDKVKHEVHGDDKHHDDDDSGDILDTILEGEGEDTEDDVFDSVWDATFGPLIEYVFLAPYTLPRLALEDDGSVDGRFDLYPYKNGAGYWLLADDVPSARTWSVRPRFEVGSDFDDLERVGFGLELEHVNRVGIEASWNRWHEDLAGGGTDELDLGDMNVFYRFAQSEHASYRLGVGLNYFDDDIDQEYGFNLTYAAEFLPVRPLSAGFEIDYGDLGEATLQHYRGTLGFVLESFEMFASFDYFDVDGADLRSYGLGLRGWF